MTKKIGSSLSMCLRSIAKGDVAIQDVAFIVTSTAYPNRDTMVAALRPAMMGKLVDTHMSNACTLWDTGRIFQPSVRPATRRTVGDIWADAPEFFQDGE